MCSRYYIDEISRVVQNIDWNWVCADGDIPCQKAKIRSSMQGWKLSWINLPFRTESYITGC